MMILNCIILGIVAMAQGADAVNSDCQVRDPKLFPYGVPGKASDKGRHPSSRIIRIHLRPRLYYNVRRTWYQSLSLVHAEACSSFNVTIPDSSPVPDCNGFGIRVGSHPDIKASDANLQRPSSVSDFQEITTRVTTIRTRYGGFVYAAIPSRCNQSLVDMVIATNDGSSFYNTPTYVSGWTPFSLWNDNYRHRDAPWGYIGVPGVVSLLFPRYILQSLNGRQVEDVSQTYAKVVNTLYNITGITMWPRLVKIVIDKARSNGKSFPIVVSDEYAEEMVQPGFLKTKRGQDVLGTIATHFGRGAETVDDLREKL